MRHVMLDLETWGRKPGCAIRSIGAVMFDPEGSGVGATFYRNVTGTSCDAAGLTIDPKTAEWWERQSKEARAAFLAKQSDLSTCLNDFTAFWQWNGAEFVWAHGSNFDEPIYRFAAEAAGKEVPWHYRNVRDTRTLFWLADYDAKATAPTTGGVQHNALDDAIWQANCVQTAWMPDRFNPARPAPAASGLLHEGNTCLIS